MRAERGASGVFVVVVLVLALVVIGAAMVLSRVSTTGGAQSKTSASLEAAAATLDQYAGATGRLPCPANPALDDGVASPETANVNCDYPQGTVPWKTIGLRRDNAYDDWGWKISYRVYAGVFGALTVDQGASMVNCDTTQPQITRQGVDGNMLCQAAHETMDVDFLSGKGMQLFYKDSTGAVTRTIDGTSSTGGVAYVVFSHGPTGLGAYTAGGNRRTLPTGPIEELDNTHDSGPFTIMPASAAGVVADASNHYDDILVYRTVADVAKNANLAARDWPDSVMAGVTFNSAMLTPVLGHAPAAGNLGTSTLTFQQNGTTYATVTGFNSSGAHNLAYIDNAGTNPDGIGIAGGGGNNLNSAAASGGDGVRIVFSMTAGKLAVTLGNFGTKSIHEAEQAQFQFYNGASLVQTLTKQGCLSDGTNRLASYTITPSGIFNTVVITAKPTTSSNASAFNVAEVDICSAAAATCKTTLDVAGNECP